jgi:antagonist of KipI
MDAFALRAANRLAGNAPCAAALEIGGSSARMRARADCVIAVAGAGYDLFVNDWRMPLWSAILARRGWIIRLEKFSAGNWICLAIHGGIHTSSTLGSRSTYLRARLGADPPRLCAAGDLLPIGPATLPFEALAGRTLPLALRPNYAADAVVRAVRGPQFERFSERAVEIFFSTTYRISRESDRMGYRLSGAPIETDGKELISEGMARGCVQIPSSGEPIVMQADCPTTGGYPKIAAVIAADQPLLAQVPLGAGTVRFAEVDGETAQTIFREQVAAIDAGIVNPDRDDILWSSAI